MEKSSKSPLIYSSKVSALRLSLCKSIRLKKIALARGEISGDVEVDEARELPKFDVLPPEPFLDQLAHKLSQRPDNAMHCAPDERVLRRSRTGPGPAPLQAAARRWLPPGPPGRSRWRPDHRSTPGRIRAARFLDSSAQIPVLSVVAATARDWLRNSLGLKATRNCRGSEPTTARGRTEQRSEASLH